MSKRYDEKIKRVDLDYDAKESFVKIISNYSNDYLKEAKGTDNLFELTELLKHLYKNIFTRVHNNAE